MTSASSARGTILLVEDHPTVREIVCELIDSVGYRVVSVASAGDAVRQLRNNSGGIDIMLTDLLMPRVHGPELAEIACQINPGIKVIFMSGHLPEALTQDQAKNFLQKPFTRDDLASKLAEVMQQSPSPALPSQASEDPGLHPPPAPVR